jgi:hypothetical protein
VQGDAAAWGYSEELLATAVDVLGYLAYLTKAAHFKGTHAPPDPVKRPGDGGLPDQVELEAPPRMSTPEEIRAFFSGEGTRVVVTDS